MSLLFRDTGLPLADPFVTFQQARQVTAILHAAYCTDCYR